MAEDLAAEMTLDVLTVANHQAVVEIRKNYVKAYSGFCRYCFRRRHHFIFCC